MEKTNKKSLVIAVIVLLIGMIVMGKMESYEAEQRAKTKETCTYQQIETATYMCK